MFGIFVDRLREFVIRIDCYQLGGLLLHLLPLTPMLPRILCALLISHGLLAAQQAPAASSQDPPAAEPPPLLGTGIPGGIADGTPAVPAPLPEPLQFSVKRTLTSRRQVTEAPELPGLPPVKGTINVTEGDTTDKESMDLFQGMHDLYRVEGARMAAAYQAREIAYEARRAYPSSP
jgi:hypothetical protein